MVVFNIHFGQMRLQGNIMVFRPKPPMSKLIMQNYDSAVKGDKVKYNADKL